MCKTLKFITPCKIFVRKNKSTFVKSVKLTDKQIKEVDQVAKELNISPHHFMRWCILASVKAYKNNGQYEKINIFED